MNELNKLISSPELLLAKVHRQCQSMSSPVDRLYHCDSANKDEAWQQMFLDAMRETILRQQESYVFYKSLMDLSGFNVESLQHFDDIARIPYITSAVLKKYNLTSSAGEHNALTVTSSGTTGQRADISIDETSLVRIASGIFKVYRELGLASEQEANYLFAGYSPKASHGAGTAATDQAVSHLTPRRGIHYALDLTGNGEAVFLKEESVEQLRKYVQEGIPIRILGFLHYICEIVKAYHEKYGALICPDNSFILSGGGWKEFARSYGEDFNLYTFLSQLSNIKAPSVRDSYSLVEHPVLYVACENNKLHVPALAHAIIRDVKTMKVLPYGETGLVQLFSPVLQSYPSSSLLTSDLGCLEKNCACGRASDFLRIDGRGGTKKPMTCALDAEQYIAGSHHAE